MTNEHKGNVRFRDHVSQMRDVYQQARKVDKKALSEVSTYCSFVSYNSLDELN